jgi:chemotaxis regulatin CheY-phosphate phosphatase CheZ
MNCAIMGNLDGKIAKLAFDVEAVKDILDLDNANLVSCPEGKELFLKLDDRVCRVEGVMNGNGLGGYFIVLDSGKAFNVKEFRILFNLKEFSDRLLSGTDVAGEQHLCRRHASRILEKDVGEPFVAEVRRLEGGEVIPQDMENLKEMVVNLRHGQFYEALTKEFSGKIKEIARELIDFRHDLQRKIAPDIVDIAEKQMPEATNQLEGINTTLEKSTMKIMDINEALLDLANIRIAHIKSFLKGDGTGEEDRRHKALDRIGSIKLALSQLPEAAQEVMGFLLPGLDKGTLYLERDDFRLAEQALTEPLLTMEDLVKDFGEEFESVSSLKALCLELRGLFRINGEDCPSRTQGEVVEELREELKAFEKISSLALSMTEPLSFQDLVGQRIQRIIRLVKSMEMRIEDLVISFGIKLQKYKEDPTRSFEDLKIKVEEFKSELKGPQMEGEGMDQSAIDDLLGSL